MEKEAEKIVHEAQGQLQLNRSNGRNTFYGSELEHDHYITMELHHSEKERTLSKDWLFNRGATIVRLRMTSNQFAEMITNMNCGSGVPVTIERIEGQSIEKLPEQESRKSFIHRKFKDRMTDFGLRIKERKNKAKEIVKKKTLSKADIHKLSMDLDYLIQEVEENIPFFMRCFQETMDDVVLEAKTEVENAIQHKITTLGLQALHNENKLLK